MLFFKLGSNFYVGKLAFVCPQISSICISFGLLFEVLRIGYAYITGVGCCPPMVCCAQPEFSSSPIDKKLMVLTSGEALSHEMPVISRKIRMPCSTTDVAACITLHEMYAQQHSRMKL